MSVSGWTLEAICILIAKLYAITAAIKERAATEPFNTLARKRDAESGRSVSSRETQVKTLPDDCGLLIA